MQNYYFLNWEFAHLFYVRVQSAMIVNDNCSSSSSVCAISTVKADFLCCGSHAGRADTYHNALHAKTITPLVSEEDDEILQQENSAFLVRIANTEDFFFFFLHLPSTLIGHPRKTWQTI